MGRRFEPDGAHRIPVMTGTPDQTPRPQRDYFDGFAWVLPTIAAEPAALSAIPTLARPSPAIDCSTLQPFLHRHPVNIPIFRDLLDPHIRLTTTRNTENVFTEFAVIGLRHNNILPGHPIGQANSDVT